MAAILCVFLCCCVTLLRALPSSVPCLARNLGDKCETLDGTWPCCASLPEFDAARRRTGLDDDLIKALAHGNPFFPGSDYNIATMPPNMGFIGMANGKQPPLAVTLNVMHIFDIDQKDQTFQMHYSLKSVWRDCRTMQNCSLLLRIQSDHPEFSSFWKPRFIIEERVKDNKDMRWASISMLPDGLVSYIDEHVSTFRCKFDFVDYPFDTQKCDFTFIAPELAIYGVAVEWDTRIGNGVVAKKIGNARWTISEPNAWKTKSGTKNTPFYNAQSESTHSALYYAAAQVSLERSWRKELMDFVLPTIAFWFSSWVGLLVDCTAVPARAAMAIIPVLILTNKMSSYSAQLPPMRNTNKIEIHMLCTLALLCLHLLEFGLVNYATRRERQAKAAAATKKDDAESPAPGSSDISEKVTRTADKLDEFTSNFAIRFLNERFNVFTRYFSLVSFAIYTICIFSS